MISEKGRQQRENWSIVAETDYVLPVVMMIFFRYVVTEFAGDSIVKILHDQKVTGRTHITPEHVPFIIYQLLRVLKYIHSANVGFFQWHYFCSCTIVLLDNPQRFEAWKLGANQ